MKKYLAVTLMILAVAGFAAAQAGGPTTDVLGAHLNYGRGCAACHAPHSGAYGNGANTGRTRLRATSLSGARMSQPVWQDHHHRRRRLS